MLDKLIFVADPEQIDKPFGDEVALGNGFTVTVNVVVFAQSPAVGVKVYIVVAVLFKAGDQVPVIPLNQKLMGVLGFQ